MRAAIIQGFFLFVIFLGMMNTGCALLNLEGEPQGPVEVADSQIKFSDQQTVLNTSNRQYKKMTRQKLEEESELHAQAGSMWVMEGQGAYLFAQNKTRKEGDLLNVKLDGSALKQVDTKVTVIRKLLKQLEEELAKAKQAPEDGSEESVPVPAVAAADTKKDAARKPASEKVMDEDGPAFAEPIPTRITERLPDGTYRVQGQAPFMIGQREYKVIVTGMIRPEDYNDDGVSSNKLLDAQYDVIGIRKKEVTR